MILLALDGTGAGLSRASLELVSLGRQLAGDSPLGGFLIGDPVHPLLDQARCAVDQLWLLRGEGLPSTDPQRAAQAAEAALQAAEAQLLLLPAGRLGRSYSPRLAVQRGWALLEDAAELQLDGQQLSATCYAYLGRIWQRRSTHPPAVVSVKAGSVSPAELVSVPAAEVRVLEVATSSPLEERDFVGQKLSRVPLSEAEVVVTGGRGLGSQEAFAMLEELADLLGAGVGATRAVVDAGWRPYAEQVGQTGQTVQPKVYLAIGVSGAVQHLSGMNKSGYIVAVNKDPEAPMVKSSDLAVIGDLHKVVPALIQALRGRRD